MQNLIHHWLVYHAIRIISLRIGDRTGLIGKLAHRSQCIAEEIFRGVSALLRDATQPIRVGIRAVTEHLCGASVQVEQVGGG